MTTVQLQPETTLLTLTTVPAGLQVVYGGTTYTTPVTFTAQVGGTRTIFGPSPQGASTFASWSDGGLQQHDIVIGSIATTYTATYSGTAPTPTVTSTTPTAGATGASVLTAPSATFSVAMNASTITASTFTLTKQGTTDTGRGDRVVRRCHPEGHVDARVRPRAGNPVHRKGGGWTVRCQEQPRRRPGQDVTWTFTTSTSTTTYLSDLTWTSATNGWGPVEKDKSNGDSPAGDGKTITLNGTTYREGPRGSCRLGHPLSARAQRAPPSTRASESTTRSETRHRSSSRSGIDGTKLYDSGG